MINIAVSSIMDRLSESGVRRRVLSDLAAKDLTIGTPISSAFFKVESLDSSATYSGEIRIQLAANGHIALTVQLAGWKSQSILKTYPLMGRALETIQQFEDFSILLDYVPEGLFSSGDYACASALRKQDIAKQIRFIHDDIRAEFDRIYFREPTASWN